MTVQGILAGAALVATILFGVWRMIESLRKENRDAHAGINRRIDRQDEKLDRQAEKLDKQAEKLSAIARDVAFLAGRQAERDQSPR